MHSVLNFLEINGMGILQSYFHNWFLHAPTKDSEHVKPPPRLELGKQLPYTEANHTTNQYELV